MNSAYAQMNKAIAAMLEVDEEMLTLLADERDADAAAITPQSMWMTLTDDQAIDAGIATPEIIARYEARQRATRAAFDALPWRVRFMRRHVRPRSYEARRRLTNAYKALRGEW